jgi:hypothetical protein
MVAPNWSTLVASKTVNVPKKELWVMVCDFVRGPRRLRVTANGKWKYDPDSECGPEGDPSEGFDDRNLHKSALRGCLVAKVGGSAGDTPGSEKLFAIGSHCVFDIPENTGGSLFVTMNDDPRRFHLHDGALTIEVSEAPLA